MNRSALLTRKSSIEATVKTINENTSLRPAQKLKQLQALRPQLDEIETELTRIRVEKGFRAGNDLTEPLATGVVTKQLGAPPIALPEEAMRALHQAIVSKSSLAVTTKAAADVMGLLPSQLVPNVLGPAHEGMRVLDYLRKTPTNAPSVEYIRHNSTTGTPATVAPGAPKPELTFNTAQLVAPVRKIAAWTSANYESLRDFANFSSYVTGELQQQIIDVENAQLLLGDGTGTNLTGLLVTPGIITRAVGTSPVESGLDAIEEAITDMRSGSALAVADLLVMHPTTWSKLRRSKDSQGRYLVQADPTSGDAHSLWGVPVVQTTVLAVGTVGVVGTDKAATVHIREGLSVSTNPYAQATSNITQFIGEEFLALAVERPAAIAKVTGVIG